MKVIKTAMVGNAKAVLFSSGDIGFAGQIFPHGAGCNLSVLRALGIA